MQALNEEKSQRKGAKERKENLKTGKTGKNARSRILRAVSSFIPRIDPFSYFFPLRPFLSPSRPLRQRF